MGCRCWFTTSFCSLCVWVQSIDESAVVKRGGQHFSGAQHRCDSPGRANQRKFYNVSVHVLVRRAASTS